jgi:hypothetical protein
VAIPELTRKAAEKLVAESCESRVPAHLRDEIRINHKVRGNYITIYEHRPLFMGQGEWTSMAVAQFRYAPETQRWTLYCADRNLRWHRYLDLDPDPSLEPLLKEVDDDPTGIFWG